MVDLAKEIDKIAYCSHDWKVSHGTIHSPYVFCTVCLEQKPLIPSAAFKKMMSKDDVEVRMTRTWKSK